ncbi:hypothetical protein [Pseudonocardia acidicola]|uniref:Uncharacterized protein n=1 Tax=Pseudonocardia acidicola TaxID=2724939 RepID=A0ABX1S6E7_9PSEU|nr:hypothetical protein [Pseudonocardia acidicola]NMH95926.1 hypothetical protein [Pseudonocardia acidicola]
MPGCLWADLRRCADPANTGPGLPTRGHLVPRRARTIRAGRSAEAMRACRACRRGLQDLGVQAAPHTRRLAAMAIGRHAEQQISSSG